MAKVKKSKEDNKEEIAPIELDLGLETLKEKINEIGAEVREVSLAKDELLMLHARMTSLEKFIKKALS